MTITNGTGTIRKLQYSTDDGAVHVGDEHFNVLIPNGYGDGTFLLSIYENTDEWDTFEGTWRDSNGVSAWHFFTSFESDMPMTTTEGENLKPGRYGAYYRDGDVALVAWGLY